MLIPENNRRAVALTVALIVASPAIAATPADGTTSNDSAAASPSAAAPDASAAGGASSSDPPLVLAAPLQGVVISAQRLDAARAGIQTQTGASTYTISAQAIQAAPGGDNVQLNQVILQAPDVAQDSFGQMHIRGEHNACNIG